MLIKDCRQSGLLNENPKEVLKMLWSRLMEFQEDALERQTRVRREWEGLHKGGQTCIQFLPKFEAAVSELSLAELGKSDRELFLAYLEKVPPEQSRVILADRRGYPRANAPD